MKNGLTTAWAIAKESRVDFGFFIWYNYQEKRGCDGMSEKIENRLIDIIKTDTKLDMDVRTEYLTLARSFIADFNHNMLLSSLELDDKYSFGIDAWSSFLNHPSIKKYVDGFVNELIARSADKSLVTGEKVRDSIGVKAHMEKVADRGTNFNFVVFRLPEKKEEIYEYDGDI